MRAIAFPLAATLCLSGSLCAEETLPPDLGTRDQGIDWADFLGPQRNGKSPETGLIAKWSPPPRIVWQCEIGASYGAPAISRGRLLHYDRHGDLARLTCRNSESGTELWTYEHATDYTDMLGYNNGPRCTPVVDGNRVYLFSAEGEMHCVSLSDGERQWQVDTTKQFGVVKNFFGVGSTPIVAGELLIANIGGSPPGQPDDVYAAQGQVESNGSGVVAFDKFTGEFRWQTANELASYSSPVTATIDGQLWCFVFARGGLVGLDPNLGQIRFQFPWRARKLESVNASSPTVVGDRAFISESYELGSALLQIQREGYEVVWRDKPRSRDRSLELHWNTAVHHQGYLYGSSGQHPNNAQLRCIKFDTGEVQWSVPGWRRSSLLYVDQHFICLSEDGTLRLLRATPNACEVVGELTLRNNLGITLLKYPAWTAPVLSHGLLYVRGKDRLVCLEVIRRGQE
ncbi:MAG: PQQ-binding-like beta-propeller repeat protein [Planctomycetota bacterium]